MLKPPVPREPLHANLHAAAHALGRMADGAREPAEALGVERLRAAGLLWLELPRELRRLSVFCRSVTARTLRYCILELRAAVSITCGARR